MTDYKKFIIGFLVLLVSTSIIYIIMDNKVRIRVDEDKSSFYVKNDNNRWVVSGREYNKLFDGSSRMNRDRGSINVSYYMNGSENVIYRHTEYLRGVSIVDTYFFQSSSNELELFPVAHSVRVINGSGYFYRYEVRDLVYDGNAYDIINGDELVFGRNMKLKLQSGFRWAKVYKSGVVKAQYDILSDDEIFFFRLYDPITSNLMINLSYAINDCYGNVSLGDCFEINWSKAFEQINWSDNRTIKSGNFSWNLTQANISSTRPFLFNFTNNNTYNVTIRIAVNQTSRYWELSYINVNNTKINLSNTSAIDLINVSANSTELVNLSLDLFNISQRYVNWSINRSTAAWDFNFTLTFIEI